MSDEDAGNVKPTPEDVARAVLRAYFDDPSGFVDMTKAGRARAVVTAEMLLAGHLPECFTFANVPLAKPAPGQKVAMGGGVCACQRKKESTDGP